jgi:hypothetical protein
LPWRQPQRRCHLSTFAVLRTITDGGDQATDLVGLGVTMILELGTNPVRRLDVLLLDDGLIMAQVLAFFFPFVSFWLVVEFLSR